MLLSVVDLNPEPDPYLKCGSGSTQAKYSIK